jgi:hypothetical protein
MSGIGIDENRFDNGDDQYKDEHEGEDEAQDEDESSTASFLDEQQNVDDADDPENTFLLHSPLLSPSAEEDASHHLQVRTFEVLFEEL